MKITHEYSVFVCGGIGAILIIMAGVALNTCVDSVDSAMSSNVPNYTKGYIVKAVLEFIKFACYLGAAIYVLWDIL